MRHQSGLSKVNNHFCYFYHYYWFPNARRAFRRIVAAKKDDSNSLNDSKLYLMISSHHCSARISLSFRFLIVALRNYCCPCIKLLQKDITEKDQKCLKKQPALLQTSKTNGDHRTPGTDLNLLIVDEELTRTWKSKDKPLTPSFSGQLFARNEGQGSIVNHLLVRLFHRFLFTCFLFICPQNGAGSHYC